MLFSPTFGVRPIVIAHREQDARTALGEGPLQVTQHVQLRPLAYRAGDIPHLLDRMFEARKASALRVADMKPYNQDALRTYHWPQNFDSLREMADAVVAYAASGGLRGAAKAMGRGHSSLSRFFKKCGMVLPLFRDEPAVGDPR
jgi:transcriptional regulator with AAA-type ATPase domain